eukprot:3922426-Prymnesium_polylepis.1
MRPSLEKGINLVEFPIKGATTAEVSIVDNSKINVKMSGCSDIRARVQMSSPNFLGIYRDLSSIYLRQKTRSS